MAAFETGTRVSILLSWMFRLVFALLALGLAGCNQFDDLAKADQAPSSSEYRYPLAQLDGAGKGSTLSLHGQTWRVSSVYHSAGGHTCKRLGAVQGKKRSGLLYCRRKAGWQEVPNVVVN